MVVLILTSVSEYGRLGRDEITAILVVCGGAVGKDLWEAKGEITNQKIKVKDLRRGAIPATFKSEAIFEFIVKNDDINQGPHLNASVQIARIYGRSFLSSKVGRRSLPTTRSSSLCAFCCLSG